MLRHAGRALLAVILLFCFASAAGACNYTWYPLSNGTTADASQVMSDLNYAQTCPLVTPGPLSIVGIVNSYAATEITSHGGAGNGYAAYLNLYNTDGDQFGLRMSDSGSGTAYYAEARVASIYTSGSVPIMINTNATYNNGLRISISGATTCYTSCSNSSDRRIKTSIATLPKSSGLAAIAVLRPVSFYWKDKRKGAGQQIGLIAQEVRKTFPQVVINSETITPDTPDGLLALNYSALTAPIVLSIQQLDARTKSLPNDALRIAALEVENRRLQDELAKMQQEVGTIMAALPKKARAQRALD